MLRREGFLVFKRRFRLPSPALVLSMVALSIVLGGTAFAASVTKAPKHADAKADKALIRTMAPSLGVNHAKTADSAKNAVTATNATNATTAKTANVASAIGAVTYVKGSLADAPANGGSGFQESNASVARCPSGTVVIGTGTHSNALGVEVNQVEVFKTTTPMDSVQAYFDNFTNHNRPTNYVIAICAAVSSVNNPSNLTGKLTAR
jgi:hypothetical protein